MKSQNALRILHRNSKLVLILVIIVFTLGIFVVQKVIADDADVANPTGPIMDQQTLQANTAKTDAAEAAEKQAYLDALNGPAGNKNPSAYPTFPPSTPVPMPTGIIEAPSLFPGWGSQYHIQNVWQQVVNSNGDRLGVYAGSIADEPMYAKWYTPEQGALVILEFPADHSRTWGATTEYKAPTRAGRISVQSFNGMCLTLQSTDNTSYVFDVIARQWSCNSTTNP